ncbi:hypothetical protein BDF14DRAFT_1751609 [Spinellus fusiger]|nr:hypothetical protein BDF14DRAFT_1751609 [Spinellus fusiger]
MRFTLALLSAVFLARMATAVPAAISNGEQDIDFSSPQVFSLEPNGEYETFNWKSDASGSAVDRTFTVELSEPAELMVTDLRLTGDVYEIVDNGVVLGQTTPTEDDASVYIADPDEAERDSRVSKGTFALEAGAHEITINVADSTNELGVAAVRLVQGSQIQSLYKKDHDDDDDDDEEEDEEDEEDEDWSEHKSHDKKTVYIYYTVPEKPTTSTHEVPTITLVSTLPTETITVTSPATAYETVTVQQYALLSMPFLTIV